MTNTGKGWTENPDASGKAPEHKAAALKKTLNNTRRTPLVKEEIQGFGSMTKTAILKKAEEFVKKRMNPDEEDDDNDGGSGFLAWLKVNHQDSPTIQHDKDTFKLRRLEITGSRTTGTAKKNSDIDILVEYEGTMRTDAVQDTLDDNHLFLHPKGSGKDGIMVDFTPLNPETNGTIEQFLERNKDFRKRKI